MGCGSGIVKLILFGVNSVLALVGLALLIVAILVAVDFADAIDNVELPGVQAAPIIVIILSSIIFVIAFLGCCGACKENTCMLTTYSIICIVLFIAQVAVGIWALIEINDEGDLQNVVRKGIKGVFDGYYDNNADKDAMDGTQTAFNCCGVDGYKDYGAIFGKAPPNSCCKNYENDNSNCNTSNTSEIYTEGCAVKMTEFIEDNMRIIGIVTITLSVVEVAVAIFGLILSNSIKNEQRRGGYQ